MPHPNGRLTAEEIEPDADDVALAARLIEEGWRQTSARHRMLARTPPGISAVEALAEHSGDPKWARLLGEASAADYFRRCCADRNPELSRTLTVRQFVAFKRILGDRAKDAYAFDKGAVAALGRLPRGLTASAAVEQGKGSYKVEARALTYHEAQALVAALDRLRAGDDPISSLFRVRYAEHEHSTTFKSLAEAESNLALNRSHPLSARFYIEHWADGKWEMRVRRGKGPEPADVEETTAA